MNDGHGKFSDVTSTYAPELSLAGLIRDASFIDMNKDGRHDLVLAQEWGPIQIYYQQQDLTFHKEAVDKSSGWWNFVQPFDFDNDGDMDLIAGNLGLNSKLKASAEMPVRLYINDFDDNGQVEQIMTYFIKDKEVVFPTFREVMQQMPLLKKKFLYAKNFAKADLQHLVGTDKLSASAKLSANQFANAYFENTDGKGHFTLHPLPAPFQFVPLRAGGIIDLNHDGQMDILLAGNYYENNIEIGRYDADYGHVLINSSSGIWQGQSINLSFDGQVRKIEKIKVNGADAYLIALNNGPLRLIRFN